MTDEEREAFDKLRATCGVPCAEPVYDVDIDGCKVQVSALADGKIIGWNRPAWFVAVRDCISAKMTLFGPGNSDPSPTLLDWFVQRHIASRRSELSRYN